MRTFLKQCRWGQFLLIEGDLISSYVNLLGHWCDVEVGLFRTLLPPEGGTCIEVGSNIGMHAVPLAKLCPGGTVICYEPQRPIFHLLCANIALNNCLNVITRHAAVGDWNGRIPIETGNYEQPWNYGSFSISTGFSNEAKFDGPVTTEQVDIVSLDSDPALDQLASLDLLKIDAEGHEIGVLTGAKTLIQRFRPSIFVEPGKHENVDVLNDTMAALDYHGYWFISRRYGLDDIVPPEFDNRHHDINLLFRPNEARRLNLTPLVTADELAKGVPILTHFGP